MKGEERGLTKGPKRGESIEKGSRERREIERKETKGNRVTNLKRRIRNIDTCLCYLSKWSRSAGSAEITASTNFSTPWTPTVIESISPGRLRSGALDKVSARYRALPVVNVYWNLMSLR